MTQVYYDNKVKPNNDVYYCYPQDVGVMASIAISKVPMADKIMSLITEEQLINRVGSGGGHKSADHIKAQILLGRTFADTCNFAVGFEWRLDATAMRVKYYTDVILFDMDDWKHKGTLKMLAALEVDRYMGKKKEITNMKRRDSDIMRVNNIPVVRFDLASFKSKGKHSRYFRDANALLGYVKHKRTQFKHNPVEYMEVSQRD